jgi:hypothetical protein
MAHGCSEKCLRRPFDEPFTHFGKVSALPRNCIQGFGEVPGSSVFHLESVSFVKNLDEFIGTNDMSASHFVTFVETVLRQCSADSRSCLV